MARKTSQYSLQDRVIVVTKGDIPWWQFGMDKIKTDCLPNKNRYLGLFEPKLIWWNDTMPNLLARFLSCLPQAATVPMDTQRYTAVIETDPSTFRIQRVTLNAIEPETVVTLGGVEFLESVVCRADFRKIPKDTHEQVLTYRSNCWTTDASIRSVSLQGPGAPTNVQYIFDITKECLDVIRKYNLSS